MNYSKKNHKFHKLFVSKNFILLLILPFSISCSSDDTNNTNNPPITPDVFAAGYDGKFATLWKNGIPTILVNGNNEGVAYSVSINNGDVYVVGNEDRGEEKGVFDAAILWINGTPTYLTGGNSYALATSIFVK